MSNPVVIVLDDLATYEYLIEVLRAIQFRLRRDPVFHGSTIFLDKAKEISILEKTITNTQAKLQTATGRKETAQQALRASYGGVVDNSTVALELRRLLDTCETHFTKLYGYEQVTQGGEAPTGGIEQPQTLDENGPLQATPDEGKQAG